MAKHPELSLKIYWRFNFNWNKINDNFTSFYNPFILLFIQVVVFDLSINKYEPICDQFSKSINFIIQRFHNSISEAKTRDCSNFSCLFTWKFLERKSLIVYIHSLTLLRFVIIIINIKAIEIHFWSKNVFCLSRLNYETGVLCRWIKRSLLCPCHNPLIIK